MKIYTKTGDKGKSSLWGGTRVSKSSPRIEAYGTIDELNSIIGVICANLDTGDLGGQFRQVQKDLFTLGADLATPDDVHENLNVVRTPLTMVTRLEQEIDSMSDKLPPLHNFILPSGGVTGATMHYARAVCRRAERTCVRLAAEETINPNTVVYLNRLSDWLFTAARYHNMLSNISETEWSASVN